MLQVLLDGDAVAPQVIGAPIQRVVQLVPLINRFALLVVDVRDESVIVRFDEFRQFGAYCVGSLFQRTQEGKSASIVERDGRQAWHVQLVRSRHAGFGDACANGNRLAPAWSEPGRQSLQVGFQRGIKMLEKF
jgi:hypothetical protein